MGSEDEHEYELKLALRLKNECCKEAVKTQFKETEPQKAVEIIYEIAKIYRRRSPDKISLIKCAGLLNSAILRNPSNVSQNKSELSELCRYILEESKAINYDADLTKKAHEVKDLFKKLRNEVDQFLQALPNVNYAVSNPNNLQKQKENKITAITKINLKIADDTNESWQVSASFVKKSWELRLLAHAQ